MRSLLIVLSAVSALLVSCSIKEDRSECPCRLRLDLSPVDANVVGGKLLLSIRNEDGFSYSDTVDLSVGTGLLEVKVPRTGVRVNLWSCEAADFVGEDGLVIPFGDECPSVRMFSSYVDTDCETCTETVGIIKNYCRLTVMMDESDKYWPYELNVSAILTAIELTGLRVQGSSATILCLLMKSPRRRKGHNCLGLKIIFPVAGRRHLSGSCPFRARRMPR